MFTRIALSALTGMSGRLLRRPRSRLRRRAATASGATSSGGDVTRQGAALPVEGDAANAPPAQTPLAGGAAAATAPPRGRSIPVRQRGRTPLLATIAARSLPVLGIIGFVVTLLLGAGAVRGELPFLGPFENASPAWAVAMITIALWAVYLLWKVPQWQADAWARSGDSTPRELFEIENESRGTLGQILSGVAVLTGLIFAWQQLGQTSDNLFVTQEGQITDRFTRSVRQLARGGMTQRIGSIYSLERIARDSPRDYGPVMEVLTAFVREHPSSDPIVAGTPAAIVQPVPTDVAAAFKVIGRRTPEQIMAETEQGTCLELTGIDAVGANLAGYDLRNTCWNRSDLRGATMVGADLTGVIFAESTLAQANLDGAIAQGANFFEANLGLANLSRADLQDANLLAADLSSATLQETDLSGADLLNTDLRNALLLGTDLSGANVLNADFTGAVLSGANLATVEGLTAEQIEPAIVDSATQLPPGIEVEPDL